MYLKSYVFKKISRKAKICHFETCKWEKKKCVLNSKHICVYFRSKYSHKMCVSGQDQSFPNRVSAAATNGLPFEAGYLGSWQFEVVSRILVLLIHCLLSLGTPMVHSDGWRPSGASDCCLCLTLTMTAPTVHVFPEVTHAQHFLPLCPPALTLSFSSIFGSVTDRSIASIESMFSGAVFVMILLCIQS